MPAVCGAIIFGYAYAFRMRFRFQSGFALASVSLASAIVLIGILFVYQALFKNPGKAEAAATVIYLTSTSLATWTVPNDWDSGNNTIEVIGGGGGGGPAQAGSPASGNGGGGGGAYAKVSNVNF